MSMLAARPSAVIGKKAFGPQRPHHPLAPGPEAGLQHLLVDLADDRHRQFLDELDVLWRVRRAFFCLYEIDQLICVRPRALARSRETLRSTLVYARILAEEPEGILKVRNLIGDVVVFSRADGWQEHEQRITAHALQSSHA
jgi:hypothetical protein